jgi:hypothetical protein
MIEVPEPEMLLGVIVAPRPIEGVRARFTVPVNPLSAAIVTVELPLAPARIVMVVGLATRAKSTTWTPTVVVCVRVPLELLMVIV